MSMPDEFVHATRKLEVPNPFGLYGAVTAGAGIVLCILGFVPLFQQFADGNVARLLQRGVGPSTLPMFWSFLVAGVTSLAGLSYVGQGLRDLLRLWVPPGTPKGFQDRDEVITSLKRRAIASYHAPDIARLWTVRRLLGDRVLLLSPRLRRVAVALLGEGRRGIILTLILLAILLVPSELFTDRDLRRMWATVRSLEFLPLLGIFVGGAILRAVAAVLLVPRRAPETLSHRKSQYVDGAGHPSALFAILEETARFLDWNGLPIRVSKEEPALVSGGVSDSGTFKATMLVENQPRPIKPETSGVAAGLLLFGGATALLFGFWGLGSLRIPFRQPDYPRDLPLFGQAILTFLVALVLIVLGRRLLRHARRLYSGFRFNSKLFLLEFDGTFSRAQVTVGRAVMDSIESQNLVVRSEFSIVYYAAEAVSETAALDEPRDLLELKAALEVLQDLERFEAAVRAYQTKGAKPVGVELGDPATHDIVRANLTISNLRRVGRPATELPQPPNPPELKGMDTPAALTASAGGDTKVCPECAETVKAAARKCRFCGYRFDGEEGSRP